MTSIRVAMFGLIALAACAGCATGTRSVANGSSGMASPTTSDIQHCEGWYNAAAGACDSVTD